MTCRLIYGFIAKDETIKKLSGKQPGTFLLRFSESDIENTNKADICGCLTLAVYERDPHRGKSDVEHTPTKPTSAAASRWSVLCCVHVRMRVAVLQRAPAKCTT